MRVATDAGRTLLESIAAPAPAGLPSRGSSMRPFNRLALPLLAAAALASAAPLSARTPVAPPPAPPADASPLGANAWAVQLRAGADAAALARRVGAELVGPVATLPDTWLLRFPDGGMQPAQAAGLLARERDVRVRHHQQARVRDLRGGIADPSYPAQWHLHGAGAGHAHANVPPAWAQGVFGDGVVVGIVDSGVEHTHPDLAPNYRADLSYDYWSNDNDAMDTGSHGTAVAGVAAARDDGAACGVGAAYRAQIAGLRVIVGATTDAQEANALGHRTDAIQISNNSWGPSDSGAVLEGPGPLTAAVFADAIANGRGGLGTIYVWAGGNGGDNDNVGADGYASDRRTIAVAALANSGVRSGYSERGSALLVTAPSSGGSLGITTTDRAGGPGYTSGNCTSSFGGTSSASPLVAGIVALMLDANPNLTWRDVQHVLVRSAAPVDAANPGWVTNGAGLAFNDAYGFGLVDAEAAVALSLAWMPVAPAIEFATPVQTVGAALAAASPSASSDIVVEDSGIGALEHVEVTFNATHDYRGDIEVVLVSPAGTTVPLMRERGGDGSGSGFNDWVFTATTFWDEPADGTWTLQVRDTYPTSDDGVWQDWQLRLHGTAIAPPDAAGTFGTAPAFEATAVGATSTAHTLLLASTGEGPLVLDTDATLDDGTHFTLDPGTCVAAAELAPGTDCSMTLHFAPQQEGPLATVLRIASNAGELVLPLDGEGLAAEGHFTASAAFAPVRIGAVGGVRMFTLHSDGDAALTLATDPAINGATTFVREGGDCEAGLTLAPGESCTVGVRFVPDAIGEHTAVLQVDTNAGTLATDLTAVAVDPQASLVGASNFPDTRVGTTAIAQVLTLRSSGGTALTVLAPATLDDGSQFTLASDDCAGQTLPPEAECTIALAFAPTTRGVQATVLRLSTDAGNIAVSLAGTGTVPMELFADGFEGAGAE